MDTFILIFILGTATGMAIILLCSSRTSHQISTARLPRPSRLPSASNRTRPAIQFSMLGCFGIGDPGGNAIWSTQIPALRFVCKHEPQGVRGATLKPIFTELARRYPEIYDGHSFQEWGQLLVDLDIFRVQDKCVHIAPSGRALLDMLAAATHRESRDLASR